MKRTRQRLENLIEELNQWLNDNSKEHEARTQMEEKLREAKQELAEYK
ncbi:hypothetical protein J0383_07960 [Flavobacterium endoglycinae]|uniref:Lacal_2735 family protein n=1 Tax=Flavobacterium endoglycinae TaxID=2816357 RepID=A0ABX7QJC5_9FLAO|nr:hypothetical protein [Flavobacterium endoglycinae]QSW90734.1 hypothetical protein J0383_07960 [Flavobacterium endoglycinae]